MLNLAPQIGFEQRLEYRPGNSTAVGVTIGFSIGTGTGTISHSTPSAADPIRRTIWTAGATAGNSHGLRTNHNPFFRQIGWNLACVATWVPGASGQLQIGLTTGGALIGEPSAVVNQIIVGFDSTDANLQLMYNDGAGVSTKQDLGIARTAPVVFRMELNCAPGGNPVISLNNALTNAVILAPQAITTDLMTLTQSLAFVAQCRNTATTPPGVGLSWLLANTPF